MAITSYSRKRPHDAYPSSIWFRNQEGDFVELDFIVCVKLIFEGKAETKEGIVFTKLKKAA